MNETKIVLLVVLLIQFSSNFNIKDNSFNFGQSSGKSQSNVSENSALTINDVLKIISFPEKPLQFNQSDNITVAVIDSGINKSVIKNYWINNGEIPNNSIDDDHNGYIDDYYGWDFVTNRSALFQGSFSSHGTFISNVISSMTSNISTVHIMDVRVLDSNNKNKNFIDFANAVEYALQFSQVRVIQFSIEFFNSLFSSYPPKLHWIFTKAFLRHVAIVTVSGNGAQESLSDPGNWAETIATSSADKVQGQWFKSRYANNGSNIDITVPGTNIESLGVDGNSLTLSGTSFSAAFVGGAIALLEAYFSSRNMSVQTIRSVVQSSARNLGNCLQFGAGLLNVTKMLEIASLSNYSSYLPVCQYTYSVPTSLPLLPTSNSLDFSSFFIASLLIYSGLKKRKSTKLKRTT